MTSDGKHFDRMNEIAQGRLQKEYDPVSRITKMYYLANNTKVILPFNGKIYGRMGPMYSEKSRWLISSLIKSEKAKRVVRAFKPSIDTRDEGIFSRSEGGKHFPSTLLNEENIISEIDKLLMDKVQVVGIDELHFLKDAVSFCMLLKALGFTVYVAFLDGTFNEHGFENVHDLYSIMYEYQKTRALCYNCPFGADQEAAGTLKFKSDHGDAMRQSEDDSVPHVGGEEKYIAVCDKCRAEYCLGNRKYD